MTPLAGPLLLAIAVAATGSQCGPNNQQTGEAILIVWPVVVLLALGPQLGLLALWRKLRPAVSLDLARVWIIVMLATAVAIAVVVRAEKPWRWADAALWLWGCSYGVVLLVTTRIWLMADAKNVLLGPHVVATVVFVPLAAALYGGFADGIGDPSWLFILPGYGGWATGGLFLVLLVEVLLRRRKVA